MRDYHPDEVHPPNISPSPLHLLLVAFFVFGIRLLFKALDWGLSKCGRKRVRPFHSLLSFCCSSHFLVCFDFPFSLSLSLSVCLTLIVNYNTPTLIQELSPDRQRLVAVRKEMAQLKKAQSEIFVTTDFVKYSKLGRRITVLEKKESQLRTCALSLPLSLSPLFLYFFVCLLFFLLS